MHRLVLLLGLLLPPLALAEDCPTNIQYTSGAYLKRGDNYYYRTGNYVLRTSALYYPDGSYLKRDDNIYYPGGSYLQRGGDLYYPNAGYLKRGANYYYANGGYLKRDESFYYSNGAYARRNGVLYRPDGTQTPFPVQLSEPISTLGRIWADVRAQSENVSVDFRDLIVTGDGARITLLWNGTAFTEFDLVLNTGLPQENVFVRMTPTAVVCSLAGADPSATSFTLHGQAADVEVRVIPGHDPAQVRRVIQNALDSIP